MSADRTCSDGPAGNRRAGGAALAGLLALSCLGAAATPTAALAAPVRLRTTTQAAVQVRIKDFTFIPAAVKAAKGQPITVTNEDSAVHTLTAADHSFDSKDLPKGRSFTFSVARAGTFAFICDIHQYMQGTLTVS